MEKPRTSYKIFTAADLDRDSLIMWKVPRQGGGTTKEQIVALIEQELAKDNTGDALEMLKDYLKGIDSSFDKDIKRLDIQLEDLENRKMESSEYNISSKGESDPNFIIRGILGKLPKEGNTIDRSKFGNVEDEENYGSKTKRGKNDFPM